MSIFRGQYQDAVWGHCERCGQRMRIKKEGQKYGPICARKIEAQAQLDIQEAL